MKETDLYEPVRDWLIAAGWKVRGEVLHCDIAAVKHTGVSETARVYAVQADHDSTKKQIAEQKNVKAASTDYPEISTDYPEIKDDCCTTEQLVLVELKTVLNFDVVLQATDRQRMGDIVYIAVPAKKKAIAGGRYKLILHLLRRLELGLLLVHTQGKVPGAPPFVEEVIAPLPFNRTRSRDSQKKRRAHLLNEYHARSGDQNRGGSTRKTIMTAYREKAIYIGQLLLDNVTLSTSVLRKMGSDAKKTRGILADNYYGWFERVSKGVYQLTEKGVSEIKKYPPLSMLVMVLFCTLMLTACSFEPLSAVKPQASSPLWPTPVSPTVLYEDTGPQKGGVLRLFMVPGGSLDPLTSLNPYVMDYANFIYDPLVQMNASGRIQGVLAKSLQSSQSGKIWDILLKDGILFHDGTLLTAEDVVFSLLYAKAAGVSGAYASGLQNLNEAEAVNHHQVRIVLSEADPLFTQRLCIPILPAHALKKTASDETSLEPIGTGAYAFDEKNESGLFLKRNEAWWRAAEKEEVGHSAWPDKVLFVYGTGEADRITLFQQRKIDVTWALAAQTQQYENRKDIEIKTFSGTKISWLVFGKKGASLRQDKIQNLLLRYLSASRSMAGFPGKVPEGDLGKPQFLHPVTVGQETVPESPLTAETLFPLLEEAGCRWMKNTGQERVLVYVGDASWKKATLTIQYQSMDLERLKTAEWITTELKKVGIACSIVETQKKDLLKLARSGQFDIMLIGTDSPVAGTGQERKQAVQNLIEENIAAASVLPLYVEERAMLYQTRVKGDKTPSVSNVYGGYPSWYLLQNK